MDNHFTPSFINSLIIVWLCCLLMKLSSASNVTHTVNCIAAERKALIDFKQSLSDPSGRLSSWVGENCCQWSGITCDYISEKVTMIDLRNSLDSSIIYDYYYDHDYDHEVVVQKYKKTCLGGDISHSLLELKHLNYLDLSWNNFEGAPIPYFFGMLTSLKYLNLSAAHFGGVIPPNLGNLSNLNYLDLQVDNFLDFSVNHLHVGNLQWLSGLSSLKYLDIGGANLSSVQENWIHVVNTLSSLSELHLGSCRISSFDDSIGFLNLTSLKVLDLSYNSISSSFLWLSNLTSLTKLDIDENTFQGAIPRDFVKLENLQYLDISWTKLDKVEDRIPSFLRNICQLRYLNLGRNHFGGKLDEFLGSSSNCSQNNLETLDLSGNRLVGEIPNSLGTFKNLRSLGLSDNELWGSLPNSIGNLSLLQILDVSDNLLNETIPLSFGQLSELIEFESFQNSWKSVIIEAQLMNLTKLENIYITQEDENQHLVFNMSYGWIPPFRLKNLHLENCLVGPQFPTWLQVQTRLTGVTLSNVGISDFIPHEWVSKISSHIIRLDLSNNLLKGELSHLFTSQDVQSISGSYNPIDDSVPLRYPKLMYLYLQINLLSGPIPSNIGDLIPHLVELDLSQNHLHGTIPSISTTKMKYLEVFSLSDNQLSEELLDHWDKLEALCIIDLGNNNLSGKIPKSIGLLTSLNILILSDNHLHGEIPKSLHNCSLLKSIDLGGNRLYGSLPSWIGIVMPHLRLLNLRSNIFSGTIPRQWCNLSFLRILDLSNNNLLGEIPSCLSNWTAFISGGVEMYAFNFYNINGTITKYSSHKEKIMLVMKGREQEYSTTLHYVLTIDLSRNKLSGEIPNEITKFVSLGTLNLSNNHLVGTIPENIGAMQNLETLDLSCNHLSGKIPTSLSSIDFLSHLNLSFNNLTGSIPSGNHLQTLEDPSIYEGNPFLCGSLLHAKCPWDHGVPVILTTTEEDGEKHDSEIMFGLYISMAIGFPVGLNVLFFTIFTSRRRRIWYFRLVDRVSYFILEKIGFLEPL